MIGHGNIYLYMHKCKMQAFASTDPGTCRDVCIAIKSFNIFIVSLEGILCWRSLLEQS